MHKNTKELVGGSDKVGWTWPKFIFGEGCVSRGRGLFLASAPGQSVHSHIPRQNELYGQACEALSSITFCSELLRATLLLGHNYDLVP